MLTVVSHYFAYLARMKFIQRWGPMRNTIPENIQEHSLKVAMIAHALAGLSEFVNVNNPIMSLMDVGLT